MARGRDEGDRRLWRVRSSTPDQTARLGEWAGAASRAGDAFLLHGPVGAGKTVLASGILRGLGVPGPHPSPTFTLVRTYTGRLPVAHVDLYRLGEGAAGEDLGWDDLLDGASVLIVEWAQYLGPWTPPDGVRIDIQPATASARRLEWRALGPGGLRVLAAARRGAAAGPTAAMERAVEQSRRRTAEAGGVEEPS